MAVCITQALHQIGILILLYKMYRPYKRHMSIGDRLCLNWKSGTGNWRKIFVILSSSWLRDMICSILSMGAQIGNAAQTVIRELKMASIVLINRQGVCGWMARDFVVKQLKWSLNLIQALQFKYLSWEIHMRNPEEVEKELLRLRLNDSLTSQPLQMATANF